MDLQYCLVHLNLCFSYDSKWFYRTFYRGREQGWGQSDSDDISISCKGSVNLVAMRFLCDQLPTMHEEQEVHKQMGYRKRHVCFPFPHMLKGWHKETQTGLQSSDSDPGGSACRAATHSGQAATILKAQQLLGMEKML